MNTIRNIYCVGRNYALHAKELNNEIPSSPFLFSKPTHALVMANGQEVTLPGDRGAVHYEVEWVIHIQRDYQEGMPMEELVDRFALGIDFTLRDVQDQLKKKGHPWLLAKGFPHSALLTSFKDFTSLEECGKVDFTLQKNGEVVQRGNIKDMLFDVEKIVQFTAQHFGLGKGDLIYTGTPAGVGAISEGDQLSMWWGEEMLGECKIALK